MANPKIWGPALWTSLLYIVLNYPNDPTIDTRNDYRQFFTHLGQILPCQACKRNYCEHLKIIPIDLYLDSQASLLDWLLKVHNQINDFCGKERIDLEDFLHKYLKAGDTSIISQTGSCGDSSRLTQSNLSNGFVVFLVVIIIFLLLRKN
jgi:hypothetical protein